MKLELLKDKLKGYDVQVVTEALYSDVFALYQTNLRYFRYEQDHDITMEEAIRGINDIPPNRSRDKKKFLCLYQEGKICAVLDYLEDYPADKILWIGLFMIDGTKQGQGIGKGLVRTVLEVASQSQYQSVQLGCLTNNEQGFSFWCALGFEEIRRAVTKAEGRNGIDVIVMEKKLSE